MTLGKSLQGSVVTVRAGAKEPRVWAEIRIRARRPDCQPATAHVSGEGDGYPQPTYLSWISMAKWLCRTVDRHIAPRVSGSSGDLQRDASAANPFRLCGVLQSSAHALGITERCALASSSPTLRRYCRHSDPGWTAPPIRPDMIFGKDRCGRWLNSRAENSHQPFRRREGAMAKFRDIKTLQKFAAAHASIHNHFNHDRH